MAQLPPPAPFIPPPGNPERGKFRLLVHCHLLKPAELDAAVQEARASGSSVESVLMRRYRISKKSIGHSLNAYYQRPFIEFDDRFEISRDLLAGMDPARLRTASWVPLKSTAEAVHVLIDDPSSQAKLQDVQRMFPNQHLRFYVGLPEDIGRYIDSIAPSREAPQTQREEAAVAASPFGRPSLALLLLLILAASFQDALWKGPAAGGPAPKAHKSLSRQAAAAHPKVNPRRRTLAAARPRPRAATTPPPPAGDMHNARALAFAAKTPLENVLALRDSGLSWEAVARKLGTSLDAANRLYRGGP